MGHSTNSNNVMYTVTVSDTETTVSSFIENAINQAELELTTLNESISTMCELRPECDKLDYILAASSGALCGIIDIFLVGKPGESPLGDVTDKWFADRTKDFAELCGWENTPDKDLSSAIKHLEKKFKIPYDQTGAGDAGGIAFDLNPTNHHFKSLAHNPSLLGLFFSVLDQFTGSSHFVSGDDLISLQNANGSFELRGKTVIGKLFCAIVNWFGHLISDASGSSKSTGRGMGIPSPLWTWANDIIAIKRSLHIPAGQFELSVNELALELYKGGYDARFQTAQAIPVLINELTVRLIYSVRRLIRYFSTHDSENRSFISAWKECKPFGNPTVQRMLTVAHGAFLAIDVGEATVRSFIAGSGVFNPLEFFMRINVVGVGRFTISLYGEVKRSIHTRRSERKRTYIENEKIIVERYVEELRILYERYNDATLVNFKIDLNNGDYVTAFNKTVRLAEKRNVPDEKVLKSKADIDKYFMWGRK